jgi:hypothetical protein
MAVMRNDEVGNNSSVEWVFQKSGTFVLHILGKLKNVNMTTDINRLIIVAGTLRMK